MVHLPIISISRKERAIIEGIKGHLLLVKRTIGEFEILIDALAIEDGNSALSSLERVMNEETRADEVQRDLSLRIAEGAFFGGVREDMLTLIEKIDNIADSAKDAARFLTIDRARDEPALGILRSENMKLFISDLKGAVLALEDLISAFTISKKAVLGKVHAVEEYEEAADARKEELLKELFKESGKIDPVTVIQLRDFIYVADDIADNAEDASDVILVLIAKGYG